MWLEGIAWAQASSQGGVGTQSLVDQLLKSGAPMIVAIIAVMYFLLIRPQTKQAAERKKMLGALKRNDEVVTTGGIVGRVAELSDKLVTLERAQGVRVRVERSQIAALSSYGKMPRRDKGE
jgi:preprotein translocase subunit YajC